MQDEGKLLKKPPGQAGAARRAIRSSNARVGPEIQVRIGQHLRRLYSEVVNDGVPERFAKLLRDLDEPE